jgi:hypothetical protein
MGQQQILTLEDRIVLERKAAENEKRIIADALPIIFEKLIRSPRATWFNESTRLHSITVPMEGSACRIPEIRRFSKTDVITKLLNEQLALEENAYLKYPKVSHCSLDGDGDELILRVFFISSRFSHMD